MLPFGSVFSKFSHISLSSEDGAKHEFENTPLTRLAFSIFGIPYISLRLRARKIMPCINGRGVIMLDSGCGSGIYTCSCAGTVSRIYAIDSSAEKIKYGQSENKFPNVEFRCASLPSLPFEDKKFDLILCSEVLEHIKDDKKAFSELARVLKNGGRLILTVPHRSLHNKKTINFYHHERDGYDLQTIEDFCRQNGMRIVHFEKSSFWAATLLSDINTMFRKNLVLFTISFALLYPLAIFSEKFLRFGEANSIFCIMEKS